MASSSAGSRRDALVVCGLAVVVDHDGEREDARTTPTTSVAGSRGGDLMSTYYYLVCDECRRICPVGSRGRRVVGGLVGDDWFRAFCVAHVQHKLRCVSEHDDEAFLDAVRVDRAPTEEEKELAAPPVTDDLATKLRAVFHASVAYWNELTRHAAVGSEGEGRVISGRSLDELSDVVLQALEAAQPGCVTKVVDAVTTPDVSARAGAALASPYPEDDKDE